MLSKIGERKAVGGDLLCFFYRLFHGKEDTIDENGEHDHVVEVLVGWDVDGTTPQFVPRGKHEQRPSGREPLNHQIRHVRLAH